nr:OmpH family outer membrane protein [Pseudomonadales bacterium]
LCPMVTLVAQQEPIELPPFPDGARVAFVNVQAVAEESAAGQALAVRVQALNEEKVVALQEQNEALQESQDRLAQGGNVMSQSAAAQLQREIDRMQVDIQRYTEDAQVEVQELQAELQQEFQAQLIPIIGQVATEKNIEIVLSLADAAIIWANMGLDITNEVITQFNAASEESAPPSQP